MTVQDVREAPALSCVESYFLAWLKGYCEPAVLYPLGFLPAAQVLEDFSKGAAYESYAGVPRMQELAERLGLVRRISLEHLELSGLDDGLTMIRVNPRYFHGARRVPWRPDHYLAVTARVGDSYRCVDQYPPAERLVRGEELNAWFGGRTLHYGYRGEGATRLDEAGKEALDRMSRLADDRPALQLSDRALRDALGVLRVQLKRVSAWVSLLVRQGWLCADPAFGEYFVRRQAAFDRDYLRLELCLCRGRGEGGAQAGVMERIYGGQAELASLIKTRRRL